MNSQILTASNVQVLPKKEHRKKNEKIRAVCYARVSSEQDSQTLSYENQKKYFIDYINSQENLEFAGFYGDEAISGTNRKRRVQFNQMMEDAKAHKFDLILTKSLSRWARNTLDALACIRELKALNPPVRVIFQKENIDTANAQGELVLTIMSALAQEESRSISENIRWSLQKKFQKGEPVHNLDRTMGYEYGENGEWVINPTQASIIRYIYENYADGISSTEIAKRLNAHGILTVIGKPWRSDAIMRILRNEIYAGNLILQKNVTVDFLTHKCVPNDDISPKYFIENHHPAIIEPELLSRVEKRLDEIRYRQKCTKTNGHIAFPFTNLTLVDGTRLERVPYRTAAKGYTDDEGKSGYYFQNPVAKTVDLKIIPGSDRTYLCAASIEQSFMEMLYRLKREYEEKGPEAEFYKSVHRILMKNSRGDTERHKLEMMDAELKNTAEVYRKAAAGRQKAEVEGRDPTAYLELMRDIARKLETLKSQKSELESVYNTGMIEENLAAFIRELEELPTENKLGKPIVVNGLDSLPIFICEDGSVNENRLHGYRRGFFHLTPERVEAAPEMLEFKDLIYRRFIKKGTVYGDVIEYDTTLGIKLRCGGNLRTLRQFYGYKRINSDKTISVILGVWEVRKSKLFQPGHRKKMAEIESRALDGVID